MNNPKYQITKDTKGEFRFRLRSKNGEIILHSSEGYTTKQSCQNGIASVKTNSPIDNRYERKTASNEQPYFVLKAANGETLGISEMYNSVQARNNGIEAVKRDGPDAPTEDLS